MKWAICSAHTHAHAVLLTRKAIAIG